MLLERMIDIDVEENLLLIHIKTGPSSKFTILLNDDIIDSFIIDDEFMYEYSLKYVFTRYLEVKIVSEDEVFVERFVRSIGSFFKGLKKSLLGKDNRFFLVNDKNQEIRQHYDNKYFPHMNTSLFIKSVKSKKDYFSGNNICYGFFVVPDKSITLREFLPFETDTPHRYIDKLGDVVYDLHPLICESDTLFNDTHITKKSSLKIIPYILSQLHGESPEFYGKKLGEHIYFELEEHEGDLFAFKNWSYPRDNFFQENCIVETLSVELSDEYEEVELDRIPSRFRYVSNRCSRYFKNSNSLLDKRAVVIHDSTGEQLFNAFIATYREVFFYWDHWYFNKDLVEWFDPDDVIEIRTERFLENPLYPLVDEDYCVKYPVGIVLDDFSVDCDVLSFTLNVRDFCRVHLESCVKVFVDDVLVKECVFESPVFMEVSLTGFSYGEHVLKIVVDADGEFVEFCRTFPLYERLDSLFKNLKSTYKGVGNSFFRVNDRNNELLQHFDKMFVPRLDVNRFNECMRLKKSFIGSRNIDYYVFCVPDKSLVLKDFLPFDTDNPRRLICNLDDVIDLYDFLTVDDYLLNDTNLSDESCVRLVAFMLSLVNPDENVGGYEEKLLERVDIVSSEHRGNLFTNKAWSYDDELKKEFYSVPSRKVCLKDNVMLVDEEDIPVESRVFSNIKSKYYRNANAVLDKKAIILHDSSINPFIQPLIASFSEVFFYYDQWYFNKHILDWFDADIILEIREESSFENPEYPIVSEIDEVQIPLNISFNRFEVNENVLNVELKVYDLKNLPVNTDCKYIIDKHVITSSIVESSGCFKYNLEDFSNGKHTLKIIVEASETTKAKILEKHFNIQ